MINIDSLQTNFYGDKHRWWIGVVIDNQDPLRVGRIRVRIYGIHNEDKNEVPDNALPWAQVVIPTTEDGVSGLGRQVGLKPGAQVFGVFLDGSHSQVPLVVGSMPRFEQTVFDESVYVSNDPAVPTVEKTEYQPPNTKSTVALSGATNAEKAYNYFISYGFSPMHSAVIVGNLIYTSNMDTSNKGGIAGYNDEKLEQDADPFCADRGLDFQTLKAQLLFFTYDLEVNGGVYAVNQFVEIANIKQANDFWVDNYHVTDSKAARLKIVKEVNEKYNGN